MFASLHVWRARPARGRLSGCSHHDRRPRILEPLERRLALSVSPLVSGAVDVEPGPILIPPPFENLLDFGDAPLASQSGFDADYPTQTVLNGAAHLIVPGGPFLGDVPPDPDLDGLPSSGADGDDQNGADDEDGVRFVSTLLTSSDNPNTAAVSVRVTGSGTLDAWIDFNADGDWTDANERVFTLENVTPGDNLLDFSVPANAAIGQTFARFRVTSSPPPGGLTPFDGAIDGEVEDHTVNIVGGAANVEVGIVNSDVTIEAGSIVVRSGNTVLFSAEVDDVGLLSVQGTGSDESVTIDLGNGFELPGGGLDVDGSGGTNSLVVHGGGGVMDLTDPRIKISDVTQIDLSNPDANTLVIDSAAVAALAPSTGMISITGSERDQVSVTDVVDWRLTEPIRNGGVFVFTANNAAGGGNEAMQAILPHAWHNFLQPGDINNDGEFTALDILRLINELGRHEFSDPVTDLLADPLTLVEWPGVYFDYSGDDEATAFDALLGINALARLQELGAEAEPAIAAHVAVRSVEADEQVDADPAPPGQRQLLLSQLVDHGGVQVESPPTIGTEVASGEASSRAVDELFADAAFIGQLVL